MRTINKKDCNNYDVWKVKNKKVKTYHALIEHPEIKAMLKNALTEEQLGLCCYCCDVLRTSHIEHFKPQTLYPKLSLDYQNMHVSCSSDKLKKRHCGAKKDNHDPCDAERAIICPLNPNCSELFEYDQLGYISPANDNKLAKDTIDVLGLNDPSLRSSRRAVIEAYYSCPEYWKEKISDNPLPSFYNVIEYFAKN